MTTILHKCKADVLVHTENNFALLILLSDTSNRCSCYVWNYTKFSAKILNKFYECLLFQLKHLKNGSLKITVWYAFTQKYTPVNY